MTLFYEGPLPQEQRSNDNGFIRTYTHYFLINSERDDTAFAIWANPNIPKTGAAHPADPSARVKNRSIDKVWEYRKANGDIRLKWKLKVDYSTEITLVENPLLDPAEIWESGSEYQKLVELNRNGNYVTNTAGFPVKGLYIEQTRPIIHVSKSIAPTVFSFRGLPDFLNSDEVTILGNTFAVNELKFKYIGRSKIQYRNEIPFRTLRFDLHYREDKWKLNYPNEGLYQLTEGKPRPCFDERGSTALTPFPLEENGEQRPLGGDPPVLTLEDDVYLEGSFVTLLGAYMT